MSEETSTGNEGRGADTLALTTGQLQTLERSVRRRYPISETDRETAVMVARNIIENGKSQRAKMMAIRLLATLDAQSMSDEHHVEKLTEDQRAAAEKYRRIDDGKGTESFQVHGVRVVVPGLPNNPT